MLAIESITTGETMTNTADRMIDNRTITWEFPERARVGMFGLIAAESAIFAIFVVAYLFYFLNPAHSASRRRARAA
jgi:heme/copper-type cytochrome/quinol oxidase subunit 3